MFNHGPNKASTAAKGRGTVRNPGNRFDRLEVETDPEWQELAEDGPLKTEYYVDATRDILAKNDSPDVSFTYSLNPYRGCEHGCVYCYARPTHEFFGLSCGLDFESKILVKRNAADLLEKKLRSRSWVPQVVALSGNTDCYQPIEKKLEITRECLEVFLKLRNPVGIVTKNALVLRDLDILQHMAKLNLIRVTISVTTLDNKLARRMEPRTSAPQARLDALAALTEAGIPANFNVAPVIPGLTDHEMPMILKEAAERGVSSAAYILLRLPWAVKELVLDWLAQYYPERAAKVIHAVEETRAGRLNDPCFSSRMSGEGTRAETIKRMFAVTCEKYGLNQAKSGLSTDKFRRGNLKQNELF